MTINTLTHTPVHLALYFTHEWHSQREITDEIIVTNIAFSFCYSAQYGTDQSGNIKSVRPGWKVGPSF